MISLELAQALRDAGLRWEPAAGDRFVIPHADLDSEIFTLSEMTIEAREYPTGTILGFNGTTEWALDSVAKEDVLWMPREDQLRERLGAAFVSLRRAEVGRPDAPFEVTTSTVAGERTHQADDAPDAYALALLAVIADGGHDS